MDQKMKCFKNGLMHLFGLKSIKWIQNVEYWWRITKEMVDFSVNIFSKNLSSTSIRQIWCCIRETKSEKASSSIENFYGINDINWSTWYRDRTITRYQSFKVDRFIQVWDSGTVRSALRKYDHFGVDNCTSTDLVRESLMQTISFKYWIR